jgi:hypothetical protein
LGADFSGALRGFGFDHEGVRARRGVGCQARHQKVVVPRPQHLSISDENLSFNPDLRVTRQTPPTFLLTEAA